MKEISLPLPDAEATAALGAMLAPLLAAGDVVCLSGPLGAGKTTLARGLLRALGVAEEAPSPTFALVETYETGDLALWHFDLFRLERADDVWELGLEEAFASGVSLIEWPERIAGHLPANALLVRIESHGAARRARLNGGSDWAERLASAGIADGKESPQGN